MIPLPIHTERLEIRRWEDDEVEVLDGLLREPEVARYLTLHGRTTRELLDVYRTTESEHGFSFWALHERGSIVGEAGFGIHDESGAPELGWALAPRVWGHGLAAEGARACLDALFDHTLNDRAVALVDRRNERSLRTAQRIGMRRVGEVEHPVHPHVLFEVTRR